MAWDEAACAWHWDAKDYYKGGSSPPTDGAPVEVMLAEFKTEI